MHDAGVDLQHYHQPHDEQFNVQRGIWGLFIGTLVLFSNLAAQAATQIVSEQSQTLEHAAEVMHTTSTFNTITAVSGFIVCVFSMIRFVVDMYDRFKPTRKRGARPMPGDGKNPKLAKLIKATKAIVAPVKKPNGWVALVAFIVALATFSVVLLCEAAPMTVHIERPVELLFGLLSAAAWILTFKHTPRSK